MSESILDTIYGPEDLNNLSIIQLEKLAGEIRELLIHTIAHNGGHLAPNLGVVELTIALHKVFQSPKDKIVWDVGHQAYVHKILTGRRQDFSTLRQFGGISGFPKRCESEHDVFGTGHASTSISSALGIALARDISGDKYNVVAVIGDGSLTGGQAYEALNHAGHLRTNLTVILNDNEMSIAKNVGAISEYLARIRTAPTYSKVKHDIEYLLRRIPAIGDSVLKTAERVKDSLKYLLVPGILFEELGFTYVGPIDGHNLNTLMEVFYTTRSVNEPVLIHVITCKGKGYSPAERNADIFHGVGPFCVESGKVHKNGSTPSYTQVFGDTLVKLAEKNKDIIAITAAMPEGTGLKKFASLFPDRLFDVGIAEPHAVTLAGGMATQGKIPVVAIYSTFLQRAYDQVLHDICLQNLPVIFILDRAGIVGEDGATHHGVFDYSYLRPIPNLTIMSPKDENELQHMLFTATTMSKPVAIRYPRGCGPGAELEPKIQMIESGKSELLRPGTDAVFYSIGAMVEPSRAAAELLANRGIHAAVVNARFVKPLDGEMLRKLSHDYGVIITVEDNVLAGGFGTAVLEYMNTQKFNWVKLLRLGLPDEFIPHGQRSLLLEHNGLSPERIAASVESFVKHSGAKG
ncbi:MAG TPA: 1-deoxy-D-xylulose-5-phosphate synthase [Methylomusa anaerophila]|uniref:1-deoxy-D-xylulose-5-phosphate synthase n=1 Tax=Methylomusa anaerophila TaxID=1930071 RepID=A0A348APC6_9FIRM|nr:1-deoxy-D-xylulose-5-phosphate synthase [Methylomusa anaerophila]BBB92924.1 1-deoxy-D-xylulose-5-phosphate synthase [Methylomusa anaerophila]HML87241.1 1-deoxy-D-xylulose-5-phosphate synthase [Methylomusa anaerophila]